MSSLHFFPPRYNREIFASRVLLALNSASMLFAVVVLFVGLASAASIRLVSRAVSSWTYQGCYLDGVGERTLTHPSYADYSVQTIETCTAYCGANGYKFAGLEYGRQASEVEVKTLIHD